MASRKRAVCERAGVNECPSPPHCTLAQSRERAVAPAMPEVKLPYSPSCPLRLAATAAAGAFNRGASFITIGTVMTASW